MGGETRPGGYVLGGAGRRVGARGPHAGLRWVTVSVQRWRQSAHRLWMRRPLSRAVNAQCLHVVWVLIPVSSRPIAALTGRRYHSRATRREQRGEQTLERLLTRFPQPRQRPGPPNMP